MKRSGVLNSNLSRIIASMGHTDKLVVCDSGLPIPKNSDVIDLALTKNIPRFIDTLKVILEELKVEEAIVTNELVTGNSKFFKEINSLLKEQRLKGKSRKVQRDHT
jgi:D-ribose pyranase